MKTVLIYTFSFLALFITGCAKDKIPGVYRIDVQQGNDISQDMLNQLKQGMTKNQVAYVMGTPLIIDTFHPDRWDYIYSFQPGNGQREQRRITIYFKNETLDYLDGNTRTVARKEIPKTLKVDSNVVVPLSDKKVGLIEDIKEKMGMKDEEATESVTEKVDLFKDRPIPVPTQSKGILERITGSVSSDDIKEDAQEVKEETKPSLLRRFIGSGKEQTLNEPDAIDIPETDKPEALVEKELESPGLFQRFKRTVGID
jgi:outer membrane protein assembly factor BamE